jgi:hypothetical protein
VTTTPASHEWATPSAAKGGGRQPAFVTTHWSILLAASGSESTHAQDALAKLCQTYWYPLHAYVLRRGYDAHEAEKLTQEFFARLLEQKWVAQGTKSTARSGPGHAESSFSGHLRPTLCG